jgi:hypothetical protein
MSALPPKADIETHSRDVCFVPKADIVRCGKKRRYFDHFAGAPYLALMPAAFIEQIGPQVVAREEQKLSVDWVW